MGRSGYVDDYDDNWQSIRWRGAVEKAIRGKRGQRLLREMREALDAMPAKRLIDSELEAAGEFCALGTVGHARGVDMAKIDPYDAETIASEFDIAPALAREIAWINDEAGPYAGETPEQRFERVRAWLDKQIWPERGE